jgi:hypothetical protein
MAFAEGGGGGGGDGNGDRRQLYAPLNDEHASVRRALSNFQGEWDDVGLESCNVSEGPKFSFHRHARLFSNSPSPFSSAAYYCRGLYKK